MFVKKNYLILDKYKYLTYLQKKKKKNFSLTKATYDKT